MQNMYDKEKILKICGKLRQYPVEHMIMIILNEDFEPVSTNTIGIGDTETCQFSLRDIYENMDKAGKTDFILCHNHVKGRVDQSEEDDEATKTVMCKSISRGYRLVNHIIVKNNNPKIYFSYREHNFRMTANNALSKMLPDD